MARCLYETKKIGMVDLTKEFLEFMNDNFSKNEIKESIDVAIKNENLNKYLEEKNKDDVIIKINKYNDKYKNNI